jgi:hypothetical protein
MFWKSAAMALVALPLIGLGLREGLRVSDASPRPHGANAARKALEQQLKTAGEAGRALADEKNGARAEVLESVLGPVAKVEEGDGDRPQIESDLVEAGAEHARALEEIQRFAAALTREGGPADLAGFPRGHPFGRLLEERKKVVPEESKIREKLKAVADGEEGGEELTELLKNYRRSPARDERLAVEQRVRNGIDPELFRRNEWLVMVVRTKGLGQNAPLVDAIDQVQSEKGRQLVAQSVLLVDKRDCLRWPRRGRPPADTAQSFDEDDFAGAFKAAFAVLTEKVAPARAGQALPPVQTILIWLSQRNPDDVSREDRVVRPQDYKIFACWIRNGQVLPAESNRLRGLFGPQFVTIIKDEDSFLRSLPYTIYGIAGLEEAAGR